MSRSFATKRRNASPKQAKTGKNVSCLSDSTNEGDAGAPSSASRTQSFKENHVTGQNGEGANHTTALPKKQEDTCSLSGLQSTQSDSQPSHEKLERSWQRLLRESCLALSYLADLIFHHDLNNAVKLVNVCVATILGLNAYSLYLELEYNGFEWTIRGYGLAGFLILAMGLLFLLNAVMTALPREALLKRKDSPAKKSLSAKNYQPGTESPSQKVASRKSLKRKHHY